MSDIGIFFEESFVLSIFFIIGLAVFAVLSASAEFFCQKSGIGFLSVLGSNLLFAFSLWIILCVFEFIFAWRSHYLGGETSAAVILLILLAVLSSIAKKATLNAAGIRFSHDWLFVFLPVLLVLVPIVLFVLYVFALGSSWSN